MCYLALLHQITPLPGTVNYSNTAGVLRMLLNNTARGVLGTIGVLSHGPLGVAAGWAAGRATDALAGRSAAGRMARALCRTPAQNAAEEQFIEQMGRYGAAASRFIGAGGLPPPGSKLRHPKCDAKAKYHGRNRGFEAKGQCDGRPNGDGDGYLQ